MFGHFPTLCMKGLKAVLSILLLMHRGTSNLKSDSASEDIATDIVNLAVSVKNENITVYVFSLIVRNDKLDKKWKEVNELIKKHFLSNYILFIDSENINLGMLNKSGLHFNENDTRRLASNFCFSMSKWWDTICLDRPTTTTKGIVKRKNVNKILC